MAATPTLTSGLVKKHIDGGTYTTIAFAETRDRWGISVTRWTTYRNTVVFEVCRVSAADKTFRLGHFGTEGEARTYANKMWARDKH